jgi:hypothetical protein
VALLIQFLLRLAYGLSLGMLLVSPRDVPSGYFRNHLYVVLGLAALAALLSRGAAPDAFAWATAAAVVSYVGAVCWLYESPRAGRTALAVVALLALIGAVREWPLRTSAGPATTAAAHSGGASAPASAASDFWYALQTGASGALLGATLAAMLLGHWYLNAPGMQLAPLRRLLGAIFAAALLQALVSGVGAARTLADASFATNLGWTSFLALRWLFGIGGVALLAWMARETLRIPNTQSATGILYVAVIGSFVGEIAAMLLSTAAPFPV